MKLVQVSEQNKKYYTNDFIHGFNTGSKAQLEADKREAERRGKWILNQDIAEPLFKCSSCGTAQGRVSRYCPECGASMDKVLT